MLLLAGDLTRAGTPAEARRAAAVVADLTIPTVAVLGNHDYQDERVGEVTEVLIRAGVQVLEGTSTVVTVRGVRLGIAGCKGFGGGFAGAMGHEYGEPQMKAFIGHARDSADRLASALTGLGCELRIALTHYAPVAGTLVGEPPQLYPLLGSDLLARAIDRAGAALAVHGHAHHGSEHGVTTAGVPVRNVAYPVIRAPYRVYHLDPAGSMGRTVVTPRAR